MNKKSKITKPRRPSDKAFWVGPNKRKSECFITHGEWLAMPERIKTFLSFQFVHIEYLQNKYAEALYRTPEQSEKFWESFTGTVHTYDSVTVGKPDLSEEFPVFKGTE